MSTHTNGIRTRSRVLFGIPERLAPRHKSGVEPLSLNQTLNAGRGEPVLLKKEAYRFGHQSGHSL